MKGKTAAKAVAAAAAAALVTKKSIDFYNGQYQMMKGVKHLDDNIYMIDYSLDYCLDGLLKKGVKNTAELLAYVSDITLFGARILKLGGGGFACSTFDAFTDMGDHIFARNFDYKKAPCMLVWTHPENGYKSLAVADCNFMLYGNVNKPVRASNRLQTLMAPYCCMDGMNEKGLAIGILELKAAPTNQNTGKTGISTTVLIRAVLDKCATVDEAVEFFRSYDVHDAFFCCYHYQVTDACGKSVIIEYVNNEMRLFYPGDGDESEAFQYATNYFLSSDGDNKKAFGYDRADKMREYLSQRGAMLNENEAMELLNLLHLDYKHDRYPWQVITLWSIVYNLNRQTATLAAGLDYGNVYSLSVTEPCRAVKAKRTSAE